MDNVRGVRIFMMPQQFPTGCGPSCCGPVGQTEKEIQNLKNVIEKQTGLPVAVLNMAAGPDVTAYPQVVRILDSFGIGALPIIALDGEIVSMGNPTPEEAVLAVKDKLNQVKQK